LGIAGEAAFVGAPVAAAVVAADSAVLRGLIGLAAVPEHDYGPASSSARDEKLELIELSEIAVSAFVKRHGPIANRVRRRSPSDALIDIVRRAVLLEAR
jgi:hypothetical protein